MFSKGKVINFQNMRSYLLIANNLPVGRGKRSYLLPAKSLTIISPELGTPGSQYSETCL